MVLLLVSLGRCGQMMSAVSIWSRVPIQALHEELRVLPRPEAGFGQMRMTMCH